MPGHLGRPGTPLVVGGFSQGGTSSLAWGLGHPGRARGLLIFSGFLADHPDVTLMPDSVAAPPIWWGHGPRDPAIPLVLAEAGSEALREAGAPLATFRDGGVGRTIARGGRDAARRLLDGLG